MRRLIPTISDVAGAADKLRPIAIASRLLRNDRDINFVIMLRLIAPWCTVTRPWLAHVLVRVHADFR